MDDQSFLGTGMKFPIEINSATGSISTSSGNQNVKESLYIILMTAHNERMARPWFGANVYQYSFMDMKPVLYNMMIRDLTMAILAQEPRIEDVDISADPDMENGRLILTVNYTVAGSYSSDSLVFPFYLNSSGQLSEAEPENFNQIEGDILNGESEE